MKEMIQMILDSRSDVENWFLEAFYRIKKEDEGDHTRDDSIPLKCPFM